MGVDAPYKIRIERQRKLLAAAYNALRSYQYGNDSTELAKEIADKIEQEFPGIQIPSNSPPRRP